MKITVYCIGKLKESYFVSAVEEYRKRISAYAKIDIVEFPDIPIPQKASLAIEEEVKTKECARILEKVKKGEYLIGLDLNKKEPTSEEFASLLDSSLVKGGSNVSFVIGGSLGLSDALKARCDEFVCFGKMTFPHQLARIMLLEQIYRGFKILKGEPYHK